MPIYTILIRRNPTPGNAPSASQLLPGELALNSGDGFVYFLDESGSLSGTVQPINAGSASYALTASYAMNGGGGPGPSISEVSGVIGRFAIFSGSQFVTGSARLYVSGGVVQSSGGFGVSGTLFISGTTLTINGIAYNWPTIQGPSGTVLATDGAGNLSWMTVSAGTTSTTGSFTGTFTGNVLGTSSVALSAPIAISDEGVFQGSALALNFVGAGVTSAVTSNTASITIAGGGGGGGGGGAGTAYIYYPYPDSPPVTSQSLPLSKDDEFEGSALNTSIWTWRNQGFASASVYSSSVVMSSPSSAGDNFRILFQSASTDPTWQYFTSLELNNLSASVNTLAGICVMATGSSRMEVYGVRGNTNNDTLEVIGYRFTSETSFQSTHITSLSTTNLMRTNRVYLAIAKNLANITFRFSFDGYTWRNAGTFSTGTFLQSLDRVGIFINPNGAMTSASFGFFRGTVTSDLTLIPSRGPSGTTVAFGSPLGTKSNFVVPGSFGGSPLSASVTFTTPFSSVSYSIAITGEDSRTWSVENKSTSGFVINSNSSTPLSGLTYWTCVQHGET